MLRLRCAPHVLRRLRNADCLRARQVSARDSSVCSEPGRSRGFSAGFSCVLERTAALAALERWAPQIRDYTGWSTAVEGGLIATIPAQLGSYLSSKPASLSACPELVEGLHLFLRLRAKLRRKKQPFDMLWAGGNSGSATHGFKLRHYPDITHRSPGFPQPIHVFINQFRNSVTRAAPCPGAPVTPPRRAPAECCLRVAAMPLFSHAKRPSLSEPAHDHPPAVQV